MGRPDYRLVGAVRRELREPLLSRDPSALRADACGQHSERLSLETLEYFCLLEDRRQLREVAMVGT
jgi:hypothetical protein